jgi:hypothetical protein
LLPVGEGDQLLLYTDGVSEARDGAGRFFPLAEQTATALRAGADLESGAGRPQLLDSLVASLRDHAGDRVTDDIMLLLVTLRLAAAPRTKPQHQGPKRRPGVGTGSWHIVISGPEARASAGMKLCRGEERREEAAHGGPTVA